MIRIVAPFGFYGSGNIGDEATLNGFASLLERTGMKTRVAVGSRNPPHTSRVEPTFGYFRTTGHDPRRWLAKLRAEAHAIIGGTPIMDVLGDWPLCELTPLVQSIDRWKVPLVFVGVGIEKLRLAESRQIVANEIVPRVLHWSVRCDRDRQRLVEYGVTASNVTVAADMAWLLEPERSDFGRDCLRRCGIDAVRPLIGVNLVNENSLFDRNPLLVDALASALETLADDMDARVIFLTNEVREDSSFDKAAALRVIDRMINKDRVFMAPNNYFSPRQMMSIIDCCDLTLSMRYHFCLFSALQGVPFIAIQRSDKISDLCWDMDWTATVMPPRFDTSDIVGHGRRLSQSSTAVTDPLKRSVHKMKERAFSNVAALNALKNVYPFAVGKQLRTAGES